MMSNTEHLLRHALGPAIDGLACAVSRSGRLVLYAKGPASVQAIARRVAVATDPQVRGASVQRLDHRRLARLRTLQDLADVFGPGVVVFDPSRSLRRAIGLAVLAVALRRDLGRRLDTVLYNSDERRLHIVLSRAGVEDARAAAAQLAGARAALALGLETALHGLDPAFRTDVEIGWRRPVGRRVTAVDRASARRLSAGRGRAWPRRAASALAAFGGIAPFALPAQAEQADTAGLVFPRGVTTVTRYDAEGNVVSREVRPPPAPVATYSYDPNGNQRTVNPVGATTVTTYDPLGNVVSREVRTPSAPVVTYTYDPTPTQAPQVGPSGVSTPLGAGGPAPVTPAREDVPAAAAPFIRVQPLEPTPTPLPAPPPAPFYRIQPLGPDGSTPRSGPGEPVSPRSGLVVAFDADGNVVSSTYTPPPVVVGRPAETLGPEVFDQPQRPVESTDWSFQKEDLVLHRGGISVAATVQAYLRDRNAGLQLRGQFADSRDQEFVGLTGEAFRRDENGFVKAVLRLQDESTIGHRVQAGVGGERFVGRTTIGGEVGLEDSEREGSQPYGVGYVGRYLRDNASLFVGLEVSEGDGAPFAMAEVRPWSALPWLSVYAEAGGDGDDSYAAFGVRKQFGGGRNTLIDDDRAGILPRRSPLRFDQQFKPPTGYEDGVTAR